MKVLKFGGTSVGSVESLNNVKKIVEAIPGKAVIVVSALGGLTDKLIGTANIAAEGDKNWQTEMESVRQRHRNIIDNVVDRSFQEITSEKVEKLLDSLQQDLTEIYESQELTEKKLDLIVSYGERMSSEIVASMVKNGKRYYSPDFIKTEKWFDKNIANGPLTRQLIKETFNNIGDEEKAIVPGFISTDTLTGDITNLGRGGSDYTGALLAAALDAEVLEIWTDVDGFMTADPRIVKKALIINHLTFTESMELCTFGAKVIYPPTIYPVFHKNIPIKILNTFNPGVPGTLVTDHPYPDDFDIKGVTSRKNVALAALELRDYSKANEFMKKGLNILAKKGVSTIPLSLTEMDDRVCIAFNQEDAKRAEEILKQEFSGELSSGDITNLKTVENQSAIAIVGKAMRSRDRLSARLWNSLSRDGIEVEALANSSDTTLIYILDQDKISQALPLIHSMLY